MDINREMILENKMDNTMSCKPTPPVMVLGMAYVPPQDFNNLYDAEFGFHRGTIFKDLDKPWHDMPPMTAEGAQC